MIQANKPVATDLDEVSYSPTLLNPSRKPQDLSTTILDSHISFKDLAQTNAFDRQSSTDRMSRIFSQ